MHGIQVMWHNGVMGWGYGPFAWIHVFWWILIVVGIAALVRVLIRSDHGRPREPQDRSLIILRERYARGEIDKAEFDARKRDLA